MYSVTHVRNSEIKRIKCTFRSRQIIFGRVMALAPSADIQGSFNIGPNEEIVYKFSPLKPVSQFKANMAWMVLG
jgi:hypothetical protein